MLEQNLFEKLEKIVYASKGVIDARNEETETYFEFENKAYRKEFKKILRNHGITKTQYVRDSYIDEESNKKVYYYRLVILEIPASLYQDYDSYINS